MPAQTIVRVIKPPTSDEDATRLGYLDDFKNRPRRCLSHYSPQLAKSYRQAHTLGRLERLRLIIKTTPLVNTASEWGGETTQ